MATDMTTPAQFNRALLNFSESGSAVGLFCQPPITAVGLCFNTSAHSSGQGTYVTVSNATGDPITYQPIVNTDKMAGALYCPLNTTQSTKYTDATLTVPPIVSFTGYNIVNGVRIPTSILSTEDAICTNQ